LLWLFFELRSFFLDSTGAWTRLILARQVLYYLSHSPAHALVIFWQWGLTNYLPHWLRIVILSVSASQVPRIIDMSHQHPVNSLSFWTQNVRKSVPQATCAFDLPQISFEARAQSLFFTEMEGGRYGGREIF
jgi:hypothetical protein